MTIREQNKELKRLLSLAVCDIYKFNSSNNCDIHKNCKECDKFPNCNSYHWYHEDEADALINAEIEDTTNKIEFTEDEIHMLKWIFASANAIVQSRRTDNYDTTESNTLFYLIEKLGISDIVD